MTSKEKSENQELSRIIKFKSKEEAYLGSSRFSSTSPKIYIRHVSHNKVLFLDTNPNSTRLADCTYTTQEQSSKSSA